MAKKKLDEQRLSEADLPLSAYFGAPFVGLFTAFLGLLTPLTPNKIALSALNHLVGSSTAPSGTPLLQLTMEAFTSNPCVAVVPVCLLLS